MITASELRIGNIVQVCNSASSFTSAAGKIVEVENIYYNGINVSPGYEGAIDPDFTLDNLSGIQIMPEILLALGFEKRQEIYRFGFIYLTTFDTGEWFWCDHAGVDKCSTMKLLRYLHQLQNFYFIVTGQELPIPNLSLLRPTTPAPSHKSL